MKKLVVFLILAIWAVSAFAQSKIGGFGHFSVGYGWEDWSRVSDDLRLPERLGADLNLANGGISGGAAGFFVYDRFLVGGKGYGTAFGRHSTPRGKAEFVSGMGFLEMGAMLFANSGGFGYVFGGIGGGGSGVHFVNRSDEDWYFNGNGPQQGPGVYAYSEEDFGYGGLAGELGFALDRWVIGRNGGLKLGLETGANFWLYREEWGYEDFRTSDLSQPGNVGFYVRMTIGGGYVGSLNRQSK